ncbi:hypothetical protein [Helicobacter pylori]|nr:hypothetical protein [Helicobacter pylori]
MLKINRFLLKRAKSVTDRHDLSEWNDFKKHFNSKNRQNQGLE